MNDFTKEELEAISDELEGTLYHQLRQKIQTMIDNYCEHRGVMDIDRVFPLDYQCVHCAIKFGGHELKRLANQQDKEE